MGYTLVTLIGSAFIGGAVGAFIAYRVMYDAWITDKKDLFDKLKEKNHE